MPDIFLHQTKHPIAYEEMHYMQSLTEQERKDLIQKFLDNNPNIDPEHWTSIEVRGAVFTLKRLL